MSGSTSSLPRVVVAGGSMGGLLAAAALAPHVGSVVVVERDPLPADPGGRPGTPQALHAHGLLASGRDAIETLLPGTTAELVARGAVSRGDIGSNGRWWVGGGLLADCELGMNGVATSRALVESVVRRRVRDLPNVEVRDRVDVLGLEADAAGRRVTGLRIRDRAGSAVETLAADLVVDATGRSGRAARWFAEHGWPAPEEERVAVGVRYATTHVEAREGDLGGRSVAVSAATSEVPRGGVAIRQEGDTWIVLLFGYLEEQPPLDPDGYRAFARTVVSPDLAELLADRDLLEAPRPYRFPDCRRRRFERIQAPEGYAALGDAICSFDPTFGQGMSVAALQAAALGRGVAADGQPRNWHAEAARIADRAWMIVVGADLNIDGVEGSRPPGHGMVSRYVRRAQRVARRDPVVARACMRVTNLVDAPPALMRPGIAVRVLRPGAVRVPDRVPDRVTDRAVPAAGPSGDLELA